MLKSIGMTPRQITVMTVTSAVGLDDIGDARSLVAVSPRENRSKADRDPTEWLPSGPGARCRYIEEWRWRSPAGPCRQPRTK